MANTNFGALTQNQTRVWSKDFWRETRLNSFIMQFAGSSANSMIQRITELKKTADGDRAVITLVNETVGDGVVGDNTLKGNEEVLTADEQVIVMDQWRHAHKNAGKMNEQRTIINFREEAKRALSFTAARVLDELAFQTLSGLSYMYRPDMSLRVGSQLPLLKFAAQVTPPTSRRHLQVATGGLVTGDTSTITPTDKLTWDTLLEMKAKAADERLRPIRAENGYETYNVFVAPGGMLALKKDPAFVAAMQLAAKRGDDNPLFRGTKVGGMQGIYIDGLNVLEYRNVVTTRGAPVGSKWGAAGDVEGQRVLLCGAQALAFADWGLADWEEEHEDYNNVLGIAIGKIFGLLKPQFWSTYAKSKQDFGVITVDTAL